MKLEEIPEHEPFVLKGTISELEVRNGYHNLMSVLQQRKAKAGAVAGALIGEGAASASSQLVASYDGERTEHFLAWINDLPVYGQFDGASQLPLNQPVKAVVYREGDLLIASTIMAPRRGWCWTNYAFGSKADDKDTATTAKELTIFGLCFITVMFTAMGGFFETFEIILWGSLGILLFNFLFFRVWSSPTRSLALDQDFALLNFDQPEQIDLTECLSAYFGAKYNSYPDNLFNQQAWNYYKNIYYYRRGAEMGYLKPYGIVQGVPEHRQRLVEGVVRQLVINPTTASEHFSDPLATDDARTFSTNVRKVPFITFIGDEPVCGCFEGIDQLEEGDIVRASVCQRNSVSIVKGMVCEKKGLLWLYHPRGERAQFWQDVKEQAKYGAYITGGLLVFAGISIPFGAHPDTLWVSLLVGLSASILRGWRAIKEFPKERTWSAPITSSALKTLGFTNAETFNTNRRFWIERKPDCGVFVKLPYYTDVYDYHQLLEKRVLRKE